MNVHFFLFAGYRDNSIRNCILYNKKTQEYRLFVSFNLVVFYQTFIRIFYCVIQRISYTVNSMVQPISKRYSNTSSPNIIVINSIYRQIKLDNLTSRNTELTSSAKSGELLWCKTVVLATDVKMPTSGLP